MSARSRYQHCRQLLILVAVFSAAYGCRQISAEQQLPQNPSPDASTPDATEPFYTPEEQRIVGELMKPGGRVRGRKRDGFLVELFASKATDAGLSHLKELERLETLVLSDAQVTDAGLAHLKELPELASLHLQGGRITDEALVHLKELTSLQDLALYATEVTDRALSQLQQALPQLQVSKLAPNPEAERWVRDKLAAGEAADLADPEAGFASEADRVLSAAFLEALLTSSPSTLGLHRRRVVIKNAVVVEPIDLAAADIPYETVLGSFTFKEQVQLARSEFQKSFAIARSSFARADFRRMTVNGVFDATGSEFTSPGDSVEFDGMVVGDNANFAEALFRGPVDFTGVDVAGQFNAVEARFADSHVGVSFNHMHAAGGAFFRSAEFEGPVDFVDVSTDHFDADQARFNDPDDRVTFARMNVEGSAIFSDAVFAGPVSLANASFGSIRLSDVSWPDPPRPIELGGMTYGSVSVGDQSGSWEQLLKLANRATFDTSVYLGLEAYYERNGYGDRADHVFIAMKQRQRRELLPLHEQPWSWFLDVFIRYGRSPERAFVVGLVLVISNWLLFFRRGDGMELQNPKDASRKYNGFWYSLDHFLPFIDLQAAKVWMPRQDRWFSRHWIRVYTIIGWLLIPIGLAAVTGIIN